MRWVLPVLLVLVTACSQLAGLGDYGQAAPTDSAGGAGGAGGTASGVGGAGGEADIPAEDWTESLEVVYRFDVPDWGIDSGAGGEQPLADGADIGQETEPGDIPQGPGALALSSLSARTEASGPPFEPNGESLTFGAWLRFDQSLTGPSQPIGVLSLYTIRRSNAMLRCGFEAGQRHGARRHAGRRLAKRDLGARRLPVARGKRHGERPLPLRGRAGLRRARQRGVHDGSRRPLRARQPPGRLARDDRLARRSLPHQAGAQQRGHRAGFMRAGSTASSVAALPPSRPSTSTAVAASPPAPAFPPATRPRPL